ncbi:MAG: proline dehydrogenase family protein [Chloroflexota bacterium]|nr:proline dehydrogenase family protein [Dehalococcoidia bacterium]MDW8254778.1 proline dehydrogenase family protein [Chloroflexota bacterium]
MIDPALDRQVNALAERLAAAGQAANGVLLSPRWFQQQVLERATADPVFRTQLLRFVDVLPALRTPAAVADHVQQYFDRLEAPLVGQVAEWASHATFRPILTQLVRLGVIEMARRFIVGESPRAARSRLERLARDGIGHTIDLLGEACLSDAEADAYQRRYLDLLDLLTREAERLTPHGPVWEDAAALNISLKYSAFAPHLEPAAPEAVGEVILRRLRPVLQRAMQHGVFVNVDMEQYRFKNLTHLTFARQVSEAEFARYPHFGIVVQAYLRDALEDIAWLRALAERRGTPITVRLVKGAYWDEERAVASQYGWPVPVYERKEETDESFERCTDALLDAWPALRPAFGTHNPRSIAQAAVKAQRRGLAKHDLEFQVLYGMAEGIRETLAKDGYRTRVYVPVGAIIPGMAYLVRRLLENTSNQAWFNAGAALRAPSSRAVTSPARPTISFVNAPAARFFAPETRQQMRDALARLRAERHPLCIGGREVAGRVFEQIRSPSDPARVVGEVAQATPADVETAVAVATAAFPSWRDRPVTARAALLRRAAELMEARRFDLAALMVVESGKPWAEADGDVTEAIDYLRYYADDAERVLAPQTLGSVLGERNLYLAEPRGVAAVIAPWNFPLAIVTGMTSAALVTGNCALVKPAEQSPLIALRFVALLHEAGVPAEVVHCLPGVGETVGRALVEHPEVALIAFTGSSAVGQAIIAAAARPQARGFKKVIAEMGGKNALIVDEDADLDLAIAGTLVSAYGFAGQKCSAASRLIVVGSAFRDVVERLVPAVESLVVGPPEDPFTFVPPVISAEAQARITEVIAWGRSHARLLAAAPTPARPGWYVPPVLFGDVPEEGPLAREEIFGPVLALFHVPDFDAALRLAMSVPYALTGGVFSRNPRHLERAAREFRVGNLYLNRKITGAVVGRQPFGGLGISGIGEKAGGPDYLRQFVEPRVVSENTMRHGFVPESL